MLDYEGISDFIYSIIFIMRIALVHIGCKNDAYPMRSYPIGLMMLASYIEREVPGAVVRIIDCKVQDLMPDAIGRELMMDQPDIVGLGAMSIHADQVHAAAETVRRSIPDAKIIIGGPHATCFPEQILTDINIDAVVLGEGEKAFLEIVKAISAGGTIDNISAAGTRKRLDKTERDFISDIDKLPLPAWDKINPDLYARHTGFAMTGPRRYMSVLTSRSCPYDCIYCHNIMGRKYRPRSAQNVVNELMLLVRERGFHNIEIIDDAFNLDRPRAMDIFDGIIMNRANLNISFPNGLRADLLDDELIRIMQKAGVNYIAFAIETASVRLQKLIGKNLDVHRAEAAIRSAMKLGIFCAVFIMAGLPTETEDELNESMRFANRTPFHLLHILKATPFPGTKMFDMLDDETKGSINRNKDLLRYDNYTVNLSNIPTSKLRAIVRSAFLKYYLNPIRIYGILRAHPERKRLFHLGFYVAKRIFAAV